MSAWFWRGLWAIRDGVYWVYADRPALSGFSAGALNVMVTVGVWAWVLPFTSGDNPLMRAYTVGITLVALAWGVIGTVALGTVAKDAADQVSGPSRYRERRRALAHERRVTRYLRYGRGTVVSVDDVGRVLLWDDHRYVELRDPQGGKIIYRPIADNVNTAREAVARSFGLTSDQYKPDVET